MVIHLSIFYISRPYLLFRDVTYFCAKICGFIFPFGHCVLIHVTYKPYFKVRRISYFWYVGYCANYNWIDYGRYLI